MPRFLVYKIIFEICDFFFCYKRLQNNATALFSYVSQHAENSQICSLGREGKAWCIVCWFSLVNCSHS